MTGIAYIFQAALQKYRLHFSSIYHLGAIINLMRKNIPTIERVWIFNGEKTEKFDSPLDAVTYLQALSYEEAERLVRIEIQIRLTNREMTERTFETRYLATLFIENVSSMPV
jgi:hypothetical protein